MNCKCLLSAFLFVLLKLGLTLNSKVNQLSKLFYLSKQKLSRGIITYPLSQHCFHLFVLKIILASRSSAVPFISDKMLLKWIPRYLSLFFVFLQSSSYQGFTARTFLSIEIIGTLRSNDADGNENVKKNNRSISKTTTLHEHHGFLYISLPVFARLRREHA